MALPYKVFGGREALGGVQRLRGLCGAVSPRVPVIGHVAVVVVAGPDLGVCGQAKLIKGRAAVKIRTHARKAYAGLARSSASIRASRSGP